MARTMPGARDDIRAFLHQRPARNGLDCVLVEVTDVKGSAPRDAGRGCWWRAMRSFAPSAAGRLEYMAIEHARKILSGGRDTPAGCAIGTGNRPMLRRTCEPELPAHDPWPCG
ncbi:XdhC family protein [Brucella abortus]|nr:XdhC family protein [Brucella abortus]